MSTNEKIKVIADFIENYNKKDNINNFEEWLRAQYGNYFTENFPIPFTRKYWTKEACELSTNWVGNRMYRPDIREVLQGAFEPETPNTYYAKEMRYPEEGGYKKFLSYMAENCNIKTNKKVIKIEPYPDVKKIHFEDGSSIACKHIISSIPLPVYVDLIPSMQEHVKEVCQTLEYTSVTLIYIGLCKPDIPKYLLFYIYDHDVLAARCYSPSIKSPDNVPPGCSSLQFEIYFSKTNPLEKKQQYLISHILENSEQMNLFQKKDVIVADYKVLKFGNVIFNHGMEDNRKIIHDYLLKEPVSAYNDVFEGKMGLLRSENRLIWDIYPDI